MVAGMNLSVVLCLIKQFQAEIKWTRKNKPCTGKASPRISCSGQQKKKGQLHSKKCWGVCKVFLVGKWG